MGIILENLSLDGTFGFDSICLCIRFIQLLFLVEGVDEIILQEESLVKFNNSKKQWCANLVIVRIPAWHHNFNSSSSAKS